MNKLMEAVPLGGIVVWTFNLHFSVEISKLKSSAGHQKLFDQTMHNYAKGEREEDRDCRVRKSTAAANPSGDKF